jgi:hypothetical protein
MIMSEYTKGPWEVHVLKNKTPIVIHKKRVGLSVLFRTLTDETGVDADEGLANAHLIASAPELYEALKEIKKIAGTISGKGTQQASEIWNIINPLVAKAEGKD